jgi:hypothetical protein
MFTSRMKRHFPLTATGNVPVNNMPLSCSLSSSRAASRQFFPSAEVSMAQDFRWQPHGLSQFVRIA